jgi:hypothetical protein
MKRPSTAPAPRSSCLGKLLISVFLVFVLALVCEGTASLVLTWRDTESAGVLTEAHHCSYDPDLGWVNRRNVRVRDLYGPGTALTLNARGFRALEDYETAVPEGRYRVVCVGDSFTLGHGVDDADTYEAAIERIDPRLQAVNMGQGGYGVDQAYLWYRRDGVALDTQLVLFAFIAPDFERMLDSRFQGEVPKPVLVLRDGALAVEGVPVPDEWTSRAGGRGGRDLIESTALGRLVQRMTRRGSASEPVDLGAQVRPLAEALLAELARVVGEKGARLALVMLPLREREAGRPAEVAGWLDGQARALGLPFLDLTSDFDALTPGARAACYLEDGHLNALGNRMVAETLVRRLSAELPEFPR